MDFKSITNRAKQVVQKRGGTESLKEDAAELKDIAKGPGSLKDKAKAAMEAVKDPGEEHPGREEHGGARHEGGHRRRHDGPGGRS